MINYIGKRLLNMIPLLIGISLITFLVMQLTPGKPSDRLTDLNVKISAESKAKLIKLYGLDKPWYEQYGSWLMRIVRFDFGRSFKDDRPVIIKIGERLPWTILLNLLAMGFIFTCASLIGIYSAVKQDSWFDKGMTVFVFIGFSTPSYWFAILLMILFGLQLGWFPISGVHALTSAEFPWWYMIIDVIKHLVLPVASLSLLALASMSRYMRSSMLEVIRLPYIDAARAKGLNETTVIFKHALRNALLPIITILGLSVPQIIGGSILIETIFAYPGIGRLSYESIMSRDYPVVMGILIIAAFLTLLGNLMADITYAMVDPRIRHR
ncbi:MAG: ABC transporter permease [bacterium]